MWQNAAELERREGRNKQTANVSGHVTLWGQGAQGAAASPGPVPHLNTRIFLVINLTNTNTSCLFFYPWVAAVETGVFLRSPVCLSFTTSCTWRMPAGFWRPNQSKLQAPSINSLFAGCWVAQEMKLESLWTSTEWSLRLLVPPPPCTLHPTCCTLSRWQTHLQLRSWAGCLLVLCWSPQEPWPANQGPQCPGAEPPTGSGSSPKGSAAWRNRIDSCSGSEQQKGTTAWWGMQWEICGVSFAV